MSVSLIPVWFLCKDCQEPFSAVVDFIEHKKEKHGKKFQTTSCIIFEETSNHQVMSMLEPSREPKVKKEPNMIAIDITELDLTESETIFDISHEGDLDVLSVRKTENDCSQNNGGFQKSSVDFAAEYITIDSVDSNQSQPDELPFKETETSTNNFEDRCEAERIISGNKVTQEVEKLQKNPFVTVTRLTLAEIQCENISDRKDVALTTSTTKTPDLTDLIAETDSDDDEPDMDRSEEESSRESSPWTPQLDIIELQGFKLSTEEIENFRGSLLNVDPFDYYTSPLDTEDDLDIENLLSAQEKLALDQMNPGAASLTDQNQIELEKVKPLPASVKCKPEKSKSSEIEVTAECKLCGKTVKLASDLKFHIAICSLAHKKRHRFCAPCNKLISTPHNLKVHRLKIHKNGTGTGTGTGRKAKAKAQRVGVEHQSSLKCKICGKVYRSKVFLKNHINSHKINFKGKRGQDPSKPHTCEYCGVSFRRCDYLTSHRRVHSGEKPYSCPMPDCGKIFRTKSNLNSHKAQHSDSRPFLCPHRGCAKTFKTKSNLRQHTQAVHVDEI